MGSCRNLPQHFYSFSAICASLSHPIPTLLQLSVQSCRNDGVAPYVFHRCDDIDVERICLGTAQFAAVNAGEGGDIALLLTFFTPLQQIQVHYRWCFGLLAKKESQKRLPFLQPWCGSPCKWLITCLDCHLNNASVLFCARHLNAVMFSGKLGLFVLNFCKRLRRWTEMRVAVWKCCVCLWRRREG